MAGEAWRSDAVAGYVYVGENRLLDWMKTYLNLLRCVGGAIEG
jgi:hypothetical protein